MDPTPRQAIVIESPEQINPSQALERLALYNPDGTPFEGLGTPGAEGPQGPEGPEGPQGPAGPAGADGDGAAVDTYRWGLGSEEKKRLSITEEVIANLGGEGSWKEYQVREHDAVVDDPATEQLVCAYSGRNVSNNITRVGLSFLPYGETEWDDTAEPIASHMEDPCVVVDVATGKVYRDGLGRALIYGENKNDATQLGTRLLRTEPNSWVIGEDLGQVIDPGDFGQDEVDVDSPTVVRDGANLIGLFEIRPVGSVHIARAMSTTAAPQTWVCDQTPLINEGEVGTWNSQDIVPDSLFKQGGNWILLTHGHIDFAYSSGRYRTTDAPEDWVLGSFVEMPGNPFNSESDAAVLYSNDYEKAVVTAYAPDRIAVANVVDLNSAESEGSPGFYTLEGADDANIAATKASDRVLHYNGATGKHEYRDLPDLTALESVEFKASKERTDRGVDNVSFVIETAETVLDPFFTGLGLTPGALLVEGTFPEFVITAPENDLGTIRRGQVTPPLGWQNLYITEDVPLTLYGVRMSSRHVVEEYGGLFMLVDSSGAFLDGGGHDEISGLMYDVSYVLGESGKAVNFWNASNPRGIIAYLDTPLVGSDIGDLRIVFGFGDPSLNSPLISDRIVIEPIFRPLVPEPAAPVFGMTEVKIVAVNNTIVFDGAARNMEVHQNDGTTGTYDIALLDDGDDILILANSVTPGLTHFAHRSVAEDGISIDSGRAPTGMYFSTGGPGDATTEGIIAYAPSVGEGRVI